MYTSYSLYTQQKRIIVQVFMPSKSFLAQNVICFIGSVQSFPIGTVNWLCASIENGVNLTVQDPFAPGHKDPGFQLQYLLNEAINHIALFNPNNVILRGIYIAMWLIASSSKILSTNPGSLRPGAKDPGPWHSHRYDTHYNKLIKWKCTCLIWLKLVTLI